MTRMTRAGRTIRRTSPAPNSSGSGFSVGASTGGEHFIDFHDEWKVWPAPIVDYLTTADARAFVFELEAAIVKAEALNGVRPLRRRVNATAHLADLDG